MGLGKSVVGSGSKHIIFLHSWFCDSSSYLPLLPYLDADNSTFCLTDLRGYGRSKELKGRYDAEEIAKDVLAVTDELGWDQFHLIAHSMSTIAARRLPDSRILSLTEITPVPEGKIPDPVMGFLQGAATTDDAGAFGMLCQICTAPSKEMVANWRSCSTSEARLGYLTMMSDVKPYSPKGRVITGTKDFESYRRSDSIALPCGHFPMLECPQLLAEAIT